MIYFLKQFIILSCHKFIFSYISAAIIFPFNIYYINISILVLIVINIIIWFIYFYQYNYNIVNIILNSENRIYIFSFFCNILLFMILFFFSILFLYDIQSNLQNYVHEYADTHIKLNSLLLLFSFNKKNSINILNTNILKNYSTETVIIRFNKEKTSVDTNYIFNKYGTYDNYIQSIYTMNTVND